MGGKFRENIEAILTLLGHPICRCAISSCVIVSEAKSLSWSWQNRTVLVLSFIFQISRFLVFLVKFSDKFVYECVYLQITILVVNNKHIIYLVGTYFVAVSINTLQESGQF